MECRLCKSDCCTVLLDFPAPSIVSTTSIIDVPTIAYKCRTCGHIQKPDLPEIVRFYDRDYKISLDSEDHDQLYAIANGQPVYRTPFQAELSVDLLELTAGMRMLDYGCGKAATLARIVHDVPGITPAVFDVSSSYASHWESWVAKENQKVYKIEQDWNERFDRVMAHFVLEHVPVPIKVMSDLSRVLKPGGKALVSVPNVFSNPGDLLVLDHINHFTPETICSAGHKAGLAIETLRTDAYRGALVCVFTKIEGDPAPTQESGNINSIADYWKKARERVLDRARHFPGQNVEIYGAGFYGAFVAMLVKDSQKITHFLDRNPHLQGTEIFGIPIINPDDVLDRPLDDAPNTLYAGLNPSSAQPIMKDWCAKSGRHPASVVYL